MELNKIYNEDCLIGLSKIPDKSINLIVIDPPYNIGRDVWDKIENYIEWMGNVFKECERVLKENGSFYWFHNDFEQMSELQVWLKNNSNFEFKDFCVWNKWNAFEKGNDRQGFYYKVFSNKNLNTIPQLTEYFLRYTKGNLFSRTIKNKMKKLGLREIDFRKLKVSKNGNPTGWCSNILNGKNIPTREDWQLICTLIGDYDYDELIQTFNVSSIKNADNSITNVFNINIPNSVEKVSHSTQKPLKLIENIIKLSSNENDIVLDCFMGSGTTAIACINSNRNYVGFEVNKNYYGLSCERIQDHLKNLNKAS